MKKLITAISVILALCLALCGCGGTGKTESSPESVTQSALQSVEQPSQEPTDELPEGYIASVDEVPEFNGEPYVVIRNNEPDFKPEELKAKAYESYSELDELGRCGVVISCISSELMPTEERGSIGQVKPSGWHTVKYDIVDGKYLYNRCHLIGFQLTGENANVCNLITGTRYMNVDGMLPFENMVADYIKETDNHVLYRVTPIYDGSNLLARGVQMEAKSIEDDGDGICFNVYVYNNQPGIVIDYATGTSALIGQALPENNNDQTSSNVAKPENNSSITSSISTEKEYVLNTNTMKFHLPNCNEADKIKDKNREDYKGERDDLIKKGYSPCKRCNP